MKEKGIQLTDVDRMILESYRNLIGGLEDYLGEGYELVLHSLESYEHSVIAIANAHHSGRHEGSPITDLALNMLNEIEKADFPKGYISYFTKNKNGEPLHSSTIVIYGEGHRAIGLLCMNFYLNTPLNELLVPICNGFNIKPVLSENFVDNADELLNRVITDVRAEVEADKHVLPSLKNKEIIKRCHSQGIFQIKNAVSTVAEQLGISRNTVYLHLKSIE